MVIYFDSNKTIMSASRFLLSESFLLPFSWLFECQGSSGYDRKSGNPLLCVCSCSGSLLSLEGSSWAFCLAKDFADAQFSFLLVKSASLQGKMLYDSRG